MRKRVSKMGWIRGGSMKPDFDDLVVKIVDVMLWIIILMLLIMLIILLAVLFIIVGSAEKALETKVVPGRVIPGCLSMSLRE
jgi:hypothetical protein